MSVEFVIGAAVVIVVLVLVAWKFSPKFRAKSGKYIDKDGDGKPWR